MSIETTATAVENQPRKEDDGVTHINVYSRGVTSLGRSLSNLAECNIEHQYFGHFRTLEGLWFYNCGSCVVSLLVILASAYRVITTLCLTRCSNWA